MKLRRRLDSRVIFTIVAVAFAIVYLVIGLQPAEASDYLIDSRLEIPKINLATDVTKLSKEGTRLNTPETIVGSYSESSNKTLLIGHSTSVFTDLDETKLRDEIIYGGKVYKVREIRVTKKALIDMQEILDDEETDTIVLMTCAGRLLGEGDATHRLIIVAA